ncbi:MAG: hypothetical protein M3463_02365 [Verrucomicrobiota bacterium]|nr:hypothetical protein [Verrucomicrobiota bacterium]
MAQRSTTWGDVDLEAFCRKTGYSREHATRELSKIRRERVDLMFETKIRRRRRGKPAAWGVIVCDAAKLRFDHCSLFYDREGRPLHNYTTLAPEGEKMVPAAPPKKVSESTSPAPKLVTAVCDNPYKKKDSFGIQQTDEYGARRDVAQLRDKEDPPPSREQRRARLVRKAFNLISRLQGSHYDNCKVTFSRRTAHSYVLRALIDGHDQERICAATRMRFSSATASPWIAAPALGKSFFSIHPQPFPKLVNSSPKMASIAHRGCESGMIATHRAGYPPARIL